VHIQYEADRFPKVFLGTE